MGQAKNKRQRNPECAYCGAATEGFDHVPPKCLIPIKRTDLIMVPSCYAHNNARSDLDEKFREFIVTAVGRDTPAAVEMFDAVKRSFARDRSKRESFRQRSIFDAGLKAFKVKMETESFDPLIKHITRGLYFHHYKKQLGMDVPIKVSLQNGYDEELKEHLKEMRIHQVGDDEQFVYAFNIMEGDNTVSIWWYLFHRKVLAVAITNPDVIDAHRTDI